VTFTVATQQSSAYTPLTLTISGSEVVRFERYTERKMFTRNLAIAVALQLYAENNDGK